MSLLGSEPRRPWWKNAGIVWVSSPHQTLSWIHWTHRIPAGDFTPLLGMCVPVNWCFDLLVLNAGNVREWSTGQLSIIIPATPSNPSIPIHSLRLAPVSWTCLEQSLDSYPWNYLDRWPNSSTFEVLGRSAHCGWPGNQKTEPMGHGDAPLICVRLFTMYIFINEYIHVTYCIYIYIHTVYTYIYIHTNGILYIYAHCIYIYKI